MIKKLFAAVLALFAAMAFAAVDANKATPAELDSVKGIGPSISAKIVEERNKGAFKDWQDMITRVKGVGENNAAKFSTEGLTVNGAVFAGAPAKAAVPSTTPAVAKKDEKKAASVTAAPASSAPKAVATSPAAASGTAAAKPAEPSAADKKAAAKKDKEDKKAAKAAAIDDAKKAKADKAAEKKAAKDGKAAAAAGASAPASAAKK